MNTFVRWLIEKWKAEPLEQYRAALLSMDCVLYARPVDVSAEDFALSSPIPFGDIIDQFPIKGTYIEILGDREVVVDYDYVITVYYCSPRHSKFKV